MIICRGETHTTYLKNTVHTNCKTITTYFPHLILDSKRAHFPDNSDTLTNEKSKKQQNI